MSILSPRVRFRPAQRTDKGAAGLAFAACRTVTRWVARSQQRRQLREIAESNDFHLLKDIGVSREEAFREADKPFWRGLARDLPPPVEAPGSHGDRTRRHRIAAATISGSRAAVLYSKSFAEPF